MAADAGDRSGKGRSRHLSLWLAGMVLLLGGAFLVHALILWNDARRDLRSQAALLSRLVAQATEATFAQVTGNLGFLSERLLELHDKADAEGIARLVRSFMGSNGAVRRVIVLAPDGKVIHFSDAVERLPPGGPFAIPEVAAGYEEARWATRTVLARTLRTSFGEWAIPMRLAVRDAAGEVRLLVGAGLSIEPQDVLLSRMRLPDGFSLRLLRGDGYAQLVHPSTEALRQAAYRVPAPERVRRLVAPLLPGESGAFEDDPGIDGERRLGSFERLHGFDLVSEVSAPRSLAWKAWAVQMRNSSALFLLFAAGGLAVLVAAERVRRRASEQRSRAEGALRIAAQRLEKVFRNSPAAITVVRLSPPAVLDVNEAYERLFGLSRDEVIGRDPGELGIWITPQEREAFRARIAAEGRVANHVSRARGRDGEVIDTLNFAEIVEEGGERLALVIVLDITEQRRVEARLRESEERYRRLVEVSPDAIYVVQDERIAFANAAAARLYRARDAADLVGRSVYELTDPGAHELARRRLRAIADGAERMPKVEYRFVGLDGRMVDIEVESARLFFDGRPAALVVARDIAQRKRAMAVLADREQRIRALVELSSDWYWQTDAEHRFVERAGAVLQRMGLSIDRDMGRTRWEIGYPNMSEDDWAAHRAALERREEFRDLLLQRISPDGRPYWATISGRPLFDAGGAFLGYHGTGRDITAQVEAEQALRQLNAELERKVAVRTEALAAANRELEAFAYSVSHDLRTPLRGIDGFSQVLLEQYADRLDAEGRRLLGRVRSNAQRMGRLITDLLALARVSRADVRPAEVDLSALAAEVIEELAPEAAGRAVEWSVAPGLRARGDAGLLRIVLANLLGNALKYTRDANPARIAFGGRPVPGGFEFHVGDNGAGFDMAHAARLFEPFQRLHGTHEFEGSGIGLATVQRVVAKHGGTVAADAEPGRGATFRFTLPA